MSLENLEPLAPFRNKSRPTFLFYHNSLLVRMVQGANAPALEKTLNECLTHMKNGAALEPLSLPGVGTLLGGEAPLANALMDNPSASVASLDASGLAPAEMTIALIKPDGMIPSVTEEVINTIKRHRFHIHRTRKLWLTRENVLDMYNEHRDAPWIGPVVNYLTCAPVMVLQLSKENSIQEWRELIGPANSIRARKDFPSTYAPCLSLESLFLLLTPAFSPPPHSSTPPVSAHTPPYPPAGFAGALGPTTS